MKAQIMKKHSTYSLLFVLLLTLTQVQAQTGITYLNDSAYGDALTLRKMDIATDAENNAWIAYYDAGIGRYNDGSFTFYTKDNSPIQSNRVNDIDIMGDKICFATAAGVARISEQVWDFPGGGLTDFRTEAVLQRPNKIYALCTKDATLDSLAIFDGNHWNFIQIPGYNPSFLCHSPMEYSDGKLYWGTRNGLYCYDGSVVSIVLNDVSVNDLIIHEGYLWISLNTLTSDRESIIRYNPDSQSFLGFSQHKAYEPTHSTLGACFSADTDGSLNIIYNHDSKIISNSIYDSGHYLFIFPGHTVTNTRLSASKGENGVIYHCMWSSLAAYIIDKSEHENFQSGFWSNNLKTLDINQVGATVRSYGSMFWDGIGYPRYEVPIDSGTNSIFASGLWIGGVDQSGELHLSASTYSRSQDSDLPVYDFAPGPLNTGGTEQGQCDTSTSNQYDRVWKIDRLDVEQFIYENYNSKLFEVPDDMNDWPGNGPAGDDALAPFVDNNNDGIYSTEDGDYPQILGDQMLWWINNDNTHPNEETGGNPMGVEMQHSFYGFRYDNPQDEYTELINYQTYLRVDVINRSDQQYDSVYIGVWVDADIGNAFDDYVGCDVSRNSFYFYNGDSFDETFQNYLGYGSKPPVQTVTILNGPDADPDGLDNDNDGITDNESIKMSKFIYYNNPSQGATSATTDPFTPEEYYSYLTGHWKDNTPLCYGGNGHASGGADSSLPCDYMFPGDTDPSGSGTNGVPQPAWSETTENNTPDDRRGLCSMGPFTLEPGEKNTVDILFAYIPHDNSKTGHFNYRPKLDSLITWFNENRTPTNYSAANELAVKENQISHQVNVFPNPAADYCTIQCKENIQSISVFTINGQKISDRIINNQEAILDVRNFSPGLYIIHCKTHTGISRHKLSVR